MYLPMKPSLSLDPPWSSAEIDESLAFFAEATAREGNTPDDWLNIWEQLQWDSDLRGASQEQWRLFNLYSRISFINAG